ncbi:hypothetical protein JY651_39665 [Pyxidicoccus parkwayensis]|uniref:Uncharacterized protein n=1 Tax=Pyxidicoccus parkwayensis TaxID=2813578 RepID=A0ABX7NQW4_9BACT|nr:hypothetical protein [Pyxidicoccus parkwaysis]QSQ21251.1 hypothetical protein JY651_39665 [Pyxidicoccus parkwaysis]
MHRSLVQPSSPVPPLDEEAEVARGPSRLRWALVLSALVLAGVLLAVAGWLESEQRAILSLEPSARAALFQETWEGFEQLCVEGPRDAFVERCREQAHFLQLFPECKGTCVEQARLRTRAFR